MARPENRYELISCGLKGHALVGTDAANISPDDAIVAREMADTRWHRCLRCDGWVAVKPPSSPKSERVPSREEITLPMRGPELRDRYVLRLIAVDRAIHVIVLSGLAIAIFFFLGHRSALRHDYVSIVNGLTGTSSGKSGVGGVLGELHKLLVINPSHLYVIGIFLIGYAALEATEMVGLWLTKRWAEYLTFFATIVFIPLEVAELIKSVTTFKMITLVINLAIALYLLIAKRLFGLRGGYGAERERRQALGGWEAVERATPEIPSTGRLSDPGGSST